jgi:hypothetical protein
MAAGLNASGTGRESTFVLGAVGMGVVGDGFGVGEVPVGSHGLAVGVGLTVAVAVAVGPGFGAGAAGFLRPSFSRILLNRLIFFPFVIIEWISYGYGQFLTAIVSNIIIANLTTNCSLT